MSELPELQQRAGWFVRQPPASASGTSTTRAGPAIAAGACCRCSARSACAACSARLLDENEFLSPFGIRSLSRAPPRATPYVSSSAASGFDVGYLPAESDNGLFGGNSNWGGPIWLPVNGLLVRALINYYGYYGPEFTVECPTGSGTARDALRGRRGGEQPRRRDLHPRRARTTARVRRRAQVHRTIRSGAITSSSTSTSTATTAPASAPATRPGGPGSSRRSCTTSRRCPRNRRSTCGMATGISAPRAGPGAATGPPTPQ